MALTEVFPNLTSVVSVLPPEFSKYLSLIVLGIKTAGVLLLLYIILQVVNMVLGIKKAGRIKRMELKLEELDGKLNAILELLGEKRGVVSDKKEVVKVDGDKSVNKRVVNKAKVMVKVKRK